MSRYMQISRLNSPFKHCDMSLFLPTKHTHKIKRWPDVS